MTPLDYVYVGLAALAAGAINAVAGGGSLITFPTLVAVGIPAVPASITNTVALCPGYFGATLVQRRDLEGQGKRIALYLPVAALGGIAGAYLLLYTDPHAFDVAVPFLILFAALMVGAQNKIRTLLFGRDRVHKAEWLGMFPVAAAGVYGGYFGAGMGVMILAALGIVLSDQLLRINALKQLVSLTVNIAAAVVYMAIHDIDWPVVCVMLVCALVGGLGGGKLAVKIPADYLRWLVVVLGVVCSIIYFVKLL